MRREVVYNARMETDYGHCVICPRECGADRHRGAGHCGGGDVAVVAKVMLHMWEEPCISGTRGSGAVFFSGCNLRCSYCQNRDISRAISGERVTADRLADIFLDLQSRGAHNVDLITAVHWLPDVLSALRAARERGLTVPVVYNTSAYERTEAVDLLAPYVDVWLPDFKYADGALGAKYSSAPDYPERAAAAIDRMTEAAGAPVFDDEGILRRGVIIRHLVLPGHVDDTEAVLRTIAARWKGRALLSLMRQYTPEFAREDCDLKRRVTTYEYRRALRLARELGLDGYFQDAASATDAYTPDFGV